MEDLVHYEIDSRYATKVAYFSMEFAIDQSLKIYSGGLGFLAGSHMRSAYDLEQHMIGVGILWSYGYYDQDRHSDRTLDIKYTRKFYSFFEDPDVSVTVTVNGQPGSLVLHRLFFLQLIFLRMIFFHVLSRISFMIQMKKHVLHKK